LLSAGGGRRIRVEHCAQSGRHVDYKVEIVVLNGKSMIEGFLDSTRSTRQDGAHWTRKVDLLGPSAQKVVVLTSALFPLCYPYRRTTEEQFDWFPPLLGKAHC